MGETNDPPADFINSVSSDVIDFVAGKSFEEFKNSTDCLNDLNSYPQLTTRAKGIGFEVTKVVFRGYGAPPRLQKMHDDAIERRTQLGLERENVEQEQQMQDMKLSREEERLRKKQKMEKETRAHERELQRAAHEAQQQEILKDRQSRLEHLGNMKTSLGLSGEQWHRTCLPLSKARLVKLFRSKELPKMVASMEVSYSCRTHLEDLAGLCCAIVPCCF